MICEAVEITLILDDTVFGPCVLKAPLHFDQQLSGNS